MADTIAIAQFERRLVELGCPTRSLKDRVRELAEHFEDLKQAALDDGLSEREAEAQAVARLGDPITLAENAVTLLRQSSWWGRHPIIGFCLLPLPALLMASLFCWLSLFLLCWMLGWLFGPLYTFDEQTMAGLSDAMKVATRVATLLTLGVSLIATIYVVDRFCEMARRAALGLKWMLIACTIFALINFFGYLAIFPERASIGLGGGFWWYPWYPAQWFGSAAPLLIALGLFIRQRQLERRLAAIPMRARPRNVPLTVPGARRPFYRVPTYWVMAVVILAILGATAYVTSAKSRAAAAEKVRKARLRSEIWPAERAATLALIKARQAVIPPAAEETISLKPYLVGNNLAGVPLGIHTFGGVSFDVEGAVQFADALLPKAKLKFPARVHIPISSKCSKIELLHGAGGEDSLGVKEAWLVLNYADGSKAQMDIVTGRDVLYWMGPIYNTDSGNDRYTTSPDTELAWAGTDRVFAQRHPRFSQYSLRLYRTTFINPFPDKEVASIDFVSALRGAAPLLEGLTIEKP